MIMEGDAAPPPSARLKNADLMESMLNAAASMEMLSNELDRISLYSLSHSGSRESLQSSSRFDSAFDSHYSQSDNSSIHSQHGGGGRGRGGPSEMPSSSPLLQSRVPEMSSGGHIETEFNSPVLPPSLPHSSQKSRMSNTASPPASLHRYQHTQWMTNTASPSPGSKARVTSSSTNHSLQHDMKYPQFHRERHYPSNSITATEVTSTISPLHTEMVDLPRMQSSSTHWHDTVMVQSDVSEESSAASTPTHHIASSSNSSLDQSAGTLEGRGKARPTSAEHGPPLTPRVTFTGSLQHHTQGTYDGELLTPQVSIIATTDDYDSENEYVHSTSPRLPPRYPKSGTIFYQDSLTTQHSPLHSTHRKSSPSGRSQPSSPAHTDRKPPTRTASILQRLIRKRGSFKVEGVIKRRLPVRRSLSERITYHIRKGWIDYEEDLEFISQPSQPRAVGRMIDKKNGKYHMVQLYRPPSGRYGIYISDNPGKLGIFISRFANTTAAMFYSGLIQPGDQVIRVNGINISNDQTVDDVYDLMTASNSVIFTVIPISSRADW